MRRGDFINSSAKLKSQKKNEKIKPTLKKYN